MLRFKIICAALLAGFTAGCFLDSFEVGGVKVGKGIAAVAGLTANAFSDMSYNEEKRVGDMAALHVVESTGPVKRNEKRLRYVNLVGHSLAQVCDRPTLAYRFGILESKEINAYSAPGGYIFVTTGCLAKMKNEAELAGVLAHEIAHVTCRHVVENIEADQALQDLGKLADAGLSATNMNDHVDPAFIDGMGGALKDWYENGLSRSDELEADVVGTELLWRTGYHVDGLYHYLSRLKGQQGGLILFKNHPSVSDRLQEIKDWKSDHPEKRGGVLLTKRFQQHMR